MKLKAFFVSLLMLTLSYGSVSYAGFNSYYPPERLNCKLTIDNRLNCQEFNRQYLVEIMTNADFLKNKNKTFYFFSAVAYLASPLEATIYYTYRDHFFRVVKLKTISSSILPDFKFGNWQRVMKDMYVCTAGYMSCAITNLPSIGN